LHLIYHRRSSGYINQGRAEQAQKDLEAALELIKNYENHKAADQQVVQKALDDLKEKLKPPPAPARAGGQEP
jgi:predicted nuclease of restriction endonuclease-like RecB superfamily